MSHKSYLCSVCFVLSDLSHKKPLKLYCERCDVVFANNKNVRLHYRVKHPGETPEVLEGSEEFKKIQEVKEHLLFSQKGWLTKFAMEQWCCFHTERNRVGDRDREQMECMVLCRSFRIKPEPGQRLRLIVLLCSGLGLVPVLCEIKKANIFISIR